MEFAILLFIILLCWLGLTIYNFVAIQQIKRRLSSLERTRSSLLTRTPVSIPPAEAAKPEMTPKIEEALPSEASKAAPIPSFRTDRPNSTHHPASPAKTRNDRLESLEQLVGTRWLNWIGAVVTLIGTAFLLKFMYDRGWIGPAGRISTGMGIGIAMLYLGEMRLRKMHDLFSQSVSALGCGALFLTTYLSFKFYEFGGSSSTFALLCWFALFAVALAVVRRGPVLAFLGLLCGYLTPFLLSTGQDQAETLFAYLAVLALAAAAVNVLREWSGIPSLCIIFSGIYYIGWYARFYTPKRLLIAAIGAAGLIVLSALAALARGVWKKREVWVEECVIIAAGFIFGLYFLWEVLNEEHEQALGLILCGLTIIALAALRIARLRKASTPALESTLLGFASCSLLLVIPACCETNGAMLAWALAAIVFAEMGIRAGRFLLKIAGMFCLFAGIYVGFVQGVAHSGIFIPVANNIFLAWLSITTACFLVGFRYFRTDRDSYLKNAGLTLQLASSFMLLGLLSYEVIAWFRGQIQHTESNRPLLEDWRNVTLCSLWALYPWVWLLRTKAKSRLYELSSIHYGVLGVAFLSLLTNFHHTDRFAFLNPVLLAGLLFPAGIFLLASKFDKVDGNRIKLKPGLQIYAHLLCVILIAVELHQGLFLSAWPAVNREWMRMALISVAWALYATVLLGVGISRNLQHWRWLALGILGVTLSKVVFLDMAEARQIWRVLSFMGLGALLMICSYAYSRRERMKRIAAISGQGVKSMILILFLILGAVSAPAAEPFQDWRYHARIQAPEGQFVALPLLPQNLDLSEKSDLSDFRIVDSRGLEVPYAAVFETETTHEDIQKGTEINREFPDPSTSRLTVDFGALTAKNKITVETEGNNFRRFLRVEGSDDLRAWATLLPEGWLIAAGDAPEKRFESLPLGYNNYRYIRVAVSKMPEERTPPAIRRVSFHHIVVRKPQETAVHGRFLARNFKNGTTILDLDFGARNLSIQHFQLLLDSKRIFEKRCELSGRNSLQHEERIRFESGEYSKSRMVETSWERLGSDAIYRNTQSKLSLDLNIPSRYRYVRIEIENGNSPPLDINGVIGYSTPVYLFFEPAGQSSFDIYTGNQSAAPPRYESSKTLGALDAQTLAKCPSFTLKERLGARPQTKPKGQALVWAVLWLAVIFAAWILWNTAQSTRKEPAA
jgi:uncharacterized membrane protein